MEEPLYGFRTKVTSVKTRPSIFKRTLQVRFKGQLISKGLFAIFTWTKKRTKNFSISAPKNDTFVGSSLTQGSIFFFYLKSGLKWGFFSYYYRFSYLFELIISPDILKHKLIRKKNVLEWGSNPRKYYIFPGQK